MSELVDYQVESAVTILLVYRDGTELRLPARRLAHFLHGDELLHVRQALGLRTNDVMPLGRRLRRMTKRLLHLV